MSEDGGKYLSHGTFEAKLTEMVHRCWEIRATYTDEEHLAAYKNKIYATYLVLPPATRQKAAEVKEWLIKPVIFTEAAKRAMNPLRRNRIVLIKKYEFADKAMEKLVDVMDKDRLLILRDQTTPWRIGIDRSTFNPETDIIPELNELTEGYDKNESEPSSKPSEPAPDGQDSGSTKPKDQ